jgi:hypothetical protein
LVAGLSKLFICTVGAIKNAPSRKKSSKVWRFLAVVKNVVFLLFYYFFLAPGKSRFACGRIYFCRQDTLATIGGHEVTPFFRSGFFFARCLVKIKPKAMKNILLPKKPELRPVQSWKSQELQRPTAWAARGLQKII